MLADYQILDHLGATTGSDLYRAKILADDTLVLVKRCTPAVPAQAQRFQREYATLQTLHVPAVPQPIALFNERDCLAMVLEPTTGSLFDAVLAQRQFDLPTCLQLACQLTQILMGLHATRLTHHDIRPANFLFDPEQERVFLLDLNLATADTEQAASSDACDWAYLSPEQTGRMNRAVDYRTDLYSLGVMLYRMLTGQLPFQGKDALEFMHAHVARMPTSLLDIEPDIPPTVSDIVMRLLAKLPEERYQSAHGLLIDLERCLTQWGSHGSIAPFALGMQDVSDRFHIVSKLYGRECETKLLLDAFEHMATTGQAALVTVGGYSGIGKSSLVQELYRPVVQRQGYFIRGKFDQYQRDIPYTTLTQAFRELVQQLLTESEARVTEWHEQIQQALGANGQLIVDVLPQLELIIGPQPPLAPLPPTAAQHRFQQVFRRFVSLFASEAHPLVLFLDDLQWIDSGSLQLIEQMLTHPDTRYLLVAGAYRDNEIDTAHLLTASLDKIRHSSVVLHEITLAPLSIDSLNQLTADTLHTSAAVCAPLTQLIYERTEGNPFFFTQFLDALHGEGLLRHDAQERAWKWELDQIKAKNFADNAVDLVVQKLRLLAPEAQDMLRLAACLGNQFDPCHIALIGHRPQAEVEQGLVLANNLSLVTRTGDSYKFLHDRIQQAAYSLLPEGERAAMHLQIGRVLIAELPGDEANTLLYDIASQLNRGAACIVELEERVQVAQWNLRAGRKAMASAAYASASALFAAGLALLEEEGWESQHALAFDLMLERARCEFATTHIGEAEQLVATLLQYAASPIEQAAAYRIKISLHELRLDHKQAVDCALTCLRLCGIDLPPHPNWEQVQQEFESVWRLLDRRSIESLLDLPPMSDPLTRAVMQVFVAITPFAYGVDANFQMLVLCRMVKLSLQHGNSDSSAFAYASFGGILGPFFHRYQEGYRFAKLSCNLVDQNVLLAVKAKVHTMAQTVALQTQPIDVAFEFAQRTFSDAVENGDLVIACVIRVQIINALLLRGEALDAVWRESETALAFVSRTGFRRDFLDCILICQRLIANMRGLTAHFSTFNDAQFDEAAFEAQLTPDRAATITTTYWHAKLQARFLSGDYAVALTSANKLRTLPPSINYFHLLGYAYYTALAIAALYDTGDADQQHAWRTLLTAHADQLRELAENNPSTSRDKYTLVAAEIARITGDDGAAIHLYEEAAEAAAESGFLHNEGIAHEAAARFYFARDSFTAGRAHLQAAHDCYLRWGADGKVKQLEAHPQWRGQGTRLPAATEAGVQLDVLSVTKASQAISGRIVLDELVETLMRIVLESAGAQSGTLWLARDGEWMLAADARIEAQNFVVRLHLSKLAPELACPASVVNYVRRTGEQVLLPDATQPNPFASDPYFVEHQPRSVWCLPVRRQHTWLGLFYLEHGLVTHVFTPERQAVLELLTAQAAISLENALLYTDLAQENSERRIAEAALRAAHDELELRVQERTEELARSNTELARSNADLEQFAYVASHDLQEPLRMVTSYLQIVEQRYQSVLDADAKEFINFAVDGARRMQSLITALLAYARIGTKAKPPEPVNVQAVMGVVTRSLMKAIEEKGATVEYAGLPHVIGNETQLIQLFQNLVSNAIKFCSECAPLVQVRAQPESGKWHFAVQDNGIGIPPEHFERIFVMFQRLHTRTEYAGTGIGLAVCKKIVERHGGQIWVESSTDGTTFHFTLPGTG